MHVSNQLRRILNALVKSGGRPMLVGGCVRDYLMGMEPKDFDIEVFGLSQNQIVAAVSEFGAVCNVGQAFGITKVRVDGIEYDISVPRRENKVGVGHKDYNVVCDPTMTPYEAAKRRDFTINSVYYDVVNGQIVDNFHAIEDMDASLLRPTSEAFKEDSLRILRGMQFASRFDLDPSCSCVGFAIDMQAEYHNLPKERIWVEWEKWAKGQYPSQGLKFLQQCDWISLYPEIDNLNCCWQDPIWHPEGDAFVHTLAVCDEMAAICQRDNIVGDERTVMMFAALCHDFGKPCTTEMIDGRWRSRGHCEAGIDLAENFLQSIGAPNWVAPKVKTLVAEHLTHVREKHTARGVRRLAVRLQPANIQELLWLIEADMGGRPPLPKGLPPQAIELKEMADKLDIKFDMPKPIVMGRHLIEQGIKPSPEMGALLKLLYSAQLNGEFDTLEGGISYANTFDKVMP